VSALEVKIDERVELPDHAREFAHPTLIDQFKGGK